jgi:cytochrome P450
MSVVEYDPFSREVMTDPYPIYRELRARHRAYRIDEYDAWALPRFEDVWQVLADRERFSIVEGPVFHRDRMLQHNDGAPEPAPQSPVRSFSMLDPPRHTRLRQSMIEPFRPGAVASLEAGVRALAAARLDELAEQGGFDVRHDYASPVSAAVAARIIDVPADDGVALVTLVNRYVQRDPGQPGFSAKGAAAREEIDRYLLELVAARRRSARRDPPDVVDGLLAFDSEHGPLDDAEIVDQLVTLFIGGTETLPKVVAGGTYQLWRNPEQRAALAADPTLTPAAFEEMLRYELPLQFVGRTLRTDADVAGEHLRAGQRVVLLLICANRDEREFADSERFDVTRRMERHLGLGHGVHFCIGAHIARLEGIVMMQELLARFPRYEVDDTALEREASEFQVGWASMPIG